MATIASTERTRWDVVLLGFVCGVVGMFQTVKMSVALVMVQRDIGLTLVEASWSITAVSLTGALLGVQAGRLCEEFGVVRMLVFALILSAAAGLATAVISDPVLFIGARVVEGLGYLLVSAAAPAMMAAHAAPADRGVALAIWGAFVPVSVSVMSLVGPPILVTLGWRPLFVGSAGTALVMAAAVMLVVRGGAPAGSGIRSRLTVVFRAAPRDFAVLYASLPTLGLGVAFMSFAAMQVGFIALEPTFLIEARGLSLSAVGLVMTMTTPFAIAGTVIAGLLQRVNAPDAPSTVLAFAVMALAASAVFHVGDNVTALIASGIVFFIAGGVVGSILFASLPKRATVVVGVALLSGLMVQCGNIGVLVGAPILAGVAEGWSWSAVPLAMVAMATVGIVGVVAGRH
jgi:MFS family permease